MNHNLFFLKIFLLLNILIINLNVVSKIPVSKINTFSYDEKIIQIEQICNAHSQCLIQLQQRLSDNQEDLDLLRGQIQANKHQLSQIIDKQVVICQQINNLINNYNSLSSNTNQPTAANSTILDDKLIVHSNKNDIDFDYHEALSLVFKKNKQDQAIIAFQNFIKKYSDSIYQPNAHYWLGQLNYKKGKQDDASYHFALVAKKYPKSPKAPDALLKIGIILQNKGYKDKAKTIYHQVGKLYPNSDAAKQVQKLLIRL